MKRLLSSLSLVVLQIVTEVSFAGSVPVMRARCNEDSLDTGPATERTEWAAKCGHVTADERQSMLFEGGNPRARPMYPLYGKDDLSQLWIAPVDRNAPCNVPSGMAVVVFCVSSCYTPEQRLLFPEGFVGIKAAKDDVLTHIMALRDFSTLDNLQLVAMPVESYIEEVRPNWQDILHFKMKSGGELKVTTNHPILDQDGTMKTADKFRSGESLIHYLSGPDAIVSIERSRYFGKVYNLAPDTRLPKSNVVVAEGYLNGSAFFQNDGIELLNRQLLRRTIPIELLKIR